MPMYQLYGKYYQTLSIVTGNDVVCVGMWNSIHYFIIRIHYLNPFVGLLILHLEKTIVHANK